MKTLLMLSLLAGGMILSTGCATPAYSPDERNQQIFRNWDYEGKKMVDDFDHMFLLRPASHNTIWNVR